MWFLGTPERPDRAGDRARRLVLLLGALTMAAGVVLDVWYHAGPGDGGLTVPCCGVGFVGHLVTLAGMLLILGGVLAAGFRRRPRPEGPRERRWR